MTKITFPIPDLSGRSAVSRGWLQKGSIVAFWRLSYYESRKGLILMDSQNMMWAAFNLNDENDGVWYSDSLPENIELYDATEAEKLWVVNFYFNHRYIQNKDLKGQNPFVAFINAECPRLDNPTYIDDDFCRFFLRRVPQVLDRSKWAEVKQALWQAIQQSSGLQYNRYRVEFYCYLIGVLMIAESWPEGREELWKLDLFQRNWDHFSWMYGMAVGRVVGSGLHNFTAVVKHTGQNDRKHYLHLYLPIVENNTEKILSFNDDKPYRLFDAIRQMREEEAKVEQATDLDELYQIVFPKHFLLAMAEDRPAATIEELRQVVAEKDKKLLEYENRLSTSVTEFNAKYEALLRDFEALARASLRFDKLEENLKKLSRPTAEQIIADMMLTFDEDERILGELKKIKTAIRENDRPTYQTVYESGSVHDDKSTHLNINKKENEQKKLENNEQ